MTEPRSLLLGVAGIALTLFLVGLAAGNQPLWQAALVTAAVSFAIGLGGIQKLTGYQFTAWIITAVCAAMCYPQYFLQLGPFDFGVFQVPTIDLGSEWVILVIVQLVMFGMGTKMSVHDFVGVAKMPYPVFIGIALQFLVMPLSGYVLTKVFTFPPEIAAGVVLIGSCSSGLASNVMCYLARADLALSVTLTAVATLMAPIVTPLWMNVLAGDKVEVHFASMMAHIFKIVLLPIGAALLHDILKRASPTLKRNVYTLALVGLGYLVFLGFGGTSRISNVLSRALFEVTLLLAVAVLVGVTFHLVASKFSSVEKHIHLVSMFGIIYFTAVTTAEGRNNLLSVGLTLFLAATIHNLVGWILGFGLSSLAGLERSKAIAVGFEVAMQNGGMASGIASSMGKLGTVGLAAAVFSPWMNVSGSIIANLIRRYAPVEDDKQKNLAPQVYESTM